MISNEDIPEIDITTFYGRTWTVQELQSIDIFDVRCEYCDLVYTSQGEGIILHSKTHNKFHKYDPEKDAILKKIKKTQTRFTEQTTSLLQEKLIKIKEQSDKHHPKTFLAVKTGLASLMQMKIYEKTKPFTIFFNGNATPKEILVNSFKEIHDVHYVDSFSSKSFVTQSARSSTHELKEIDLLPKIRNKVMLTSNVDGIFLGNKSTVSDNIRILDIILAGNGYESHSGVHGTRGYNGYYNFVWLGTVNQINKRLWNCIGQMNHKPLFFRFVDKRDFDKDNLDKILESINEDKNWDGIVEPLTDYWKTVSDLFSNGKKIKWNSIKDDKETIQDILKLSVLLCSLRAHIPTRDTSESTSGGTNYNFDTPIKEDHGKLFQTLYNLACGHAMLYGRNYVTSDDLEIIVHIVMSSLPLDRIDLLQILLFYNGEINTEQIETHLSISKATALKEMKKLKLLEIVEDTKVLGKTKPTLSVQLKNEYCWIFEEKFKQHFYDTLLIHTLENSKLSSNMICNNNLEIITMKECNNNDNNDNNNMILDVYSRY